MSEGGTGQYQMMPHGLAADGRARARMSQTEALDLIETLGPREQQAVLIVLSHVASELRSCLTVRQPLTTGAMA